MAYDRDFNNVLAVWTAFNGQMSYHTDVQHDAAFRFEVNCQSTTRCAFCIQGDVTIDWGDGNSTSYSRPDSLYALRHTYYAYGTYTVTITGNLKNIRFMAEPTFLYGYRTYQVVSRVLTPFPPTMSVVTDFSYMFYACQKLVEVPADLFFGGEMTSSLVGYYSMAASIPENLFRNNRKVVSFAHCFSHMRYLEEIPVGLFNGQTLAEDFSATFAACTGYTVIPAGLFDNCPLVTDFSYTFDTAIKNTVIPAGLFYHCPLVTTFAECFAGCVKVTTIPTGLFDHCPLVESFAVCFRGYYNRSGVWYTVRMALTSVPAGLFANNPKVTTFEECFRNTSITTVPEGLFDNNPEVETFKLTFYQSYITTLPSGLFDNCPNVYSFEGCFRYCRKITSALPELWNTHPTARGTYCFLGCEAAENYADVPSGWK